MAKQPEKQMIRGVGCLIKSRRLTANQVTDLFRNDLAIAQELSRSDPTGYFTRKARMIEAAMDGFTQQRDKSKYTVGYGPGRKYIYPGLPVEFAENVDPAIRDVVDLIASCDLVAMTGFCCAGHPSAFIERRAQEGLMRIPTINKSPFLFLLLQGNSDAGYVERDLPRISAGATLPGRLRIDIGTYVDFEFMEGVPGMRRLSMRGEPQPVFMVERPGYPEVVETYRRALAKYWGRIQEYFKQVTGKAVPDPDPSEFKPKHNGWDWEWNKILERNSNGHGLPNYFYFDGRGLITPQFPEKRTGTNHL